MGAFLISTVFICSLTLFEKSYNLTVCLNEEDMISNILKNMDEDLRKKLFYGFLIIMSLFSIYAFTSSYFYKKQLEETTLVVERKLGQYKITHFYGPSPLTVDMIDTANNQELKNVFISADCPKYEKNPVGIVVPMYKILNMRATTGEKFYTYDGAYDILCTNKKVNTK